MIGKMIGALVGGKMAQNARGIGGPTGAAIGAAVPMVLSRLSIPAMLVMGVGGYAVKKYMDRKDDGTTKSAKKSSSGKSNASKANGSKTSASNNNSKKTPTSSKADSAAA
jgi:hypothetical protein